MVRLFFILLSMAPLYGYSQFVGGIQIGAGYSCLLGDNTSLRLKNGWQSGLWAEVITDARIGIYADMSYLRRGGAFDPDAPISVDYIAMSVIPRIHIPSKDKQVFLLLGIGGYVGKATKKIENDIDAGICGQIGVKWSRISTVLYVQNGAIDLTELISGIQRWRSAGLHVSVRIF